MADSPLVVFALRQADNALILGHRLSQWCGHAPMLEEEMALANMGLDLLGQARAWFQLAGVVEGQGRDEDQLAYLRDAPAYRNVLLVEQPNGDFAFTMARHLFYARFAHAFYQQLEHGSDARLVAIALKAGKEMAYHVRHASEWLIRLGDGTSESHARAQAAIDELWPFTGELFERDHIEQALTDSKLIPDAAMLKPQWHADILTVFDRAGLTCPQPGWMQSGGRAGRHSEHLGFILAELQFLQRAYPGAQW